MNTLHRWLVPTLCLALGAQAQAAAAPAPTARSVAIFPLQPLGTEPQIARRLEDLLYAQVATIAGVTLLKQDAMNAFLVAQQPLCDGATPCLVELGKTAGVQKIVYGTVASLGDAYVLDLKLIDVARAREESRQSVSLSGEQTVLIDGIRAAATQLIAPEQYVGTIALRLDKPGAQVFVDGKLAGSTPLAPITGLEPGKHALKIVLTGYTDFDQFVDVRFERTTLVNISLKGTSIDATVEALEGPATAAPPVLVEAGPAAGPAPGPFSSPLFLAGLGTVVAGSLLTVGGGMAMLVSASSFAQFNSEHDEDLIEANCNGTPCMVLKSGADKGEFDDDYANMVEAQLPFWYGGQIGLGLGATFLIGGAALMAWDLLSRPPEVEPAQP